MQQSYITFSILLLLATIGQAQWETLNHGGSFSAMDFIDSETGWIAGNGTLQMTETGGNKWNSIPIANNWNITFIDFIDETTGWALRYDSDKGTTVIIKTMDGGQNWLTQNEVAGYSLRELMAINDTMVYVLGDTILLKSSDGGSLWKNVAPENKSILFSSMWFVDGTQGIVAGQNSISWEPGIWKTYDGGSHWQEKTLPELMNIYNLQFANQSTGYFLATTDSSINVIYKTENFGDTWTVKLKNSYGIGSLYCMNENSAYCVVRDSTWRMDLLKTTNGGNNWIEQQNPDTGMVLGLNIKFITPETGFLISDRIILFRTLDSGGSWKIQSLAYPFRDVFFQDKSNGYIIGSVSGFHFDRSELFVTRDGGDAWDINTRGSDLRKILFITTTAGFLLSGYQLQKTTDGAQTWTGYTISNYDSTGIYFMASDLFFTDATTGWVVGYYSDMLASGAAIFKTHDGGEKWDLVMKYTGTDPTKYYGLNSVYFIDPNYGWAVGESGVIFRYDFSSGKWLLVEPVTDLPLTKVLFTTHDTGWIAGGFKNDNEFHPVLLKSTNGGLTWEDQNFKYLISDIYFSDPEHGWLVGAEDDDRGVLLATKDGGNLWEVQVSGLNAPLTALHFSDGYGWAAGGQGLILRTDNGGSNWIDDNNTTYHAGYRLNQNYPNPFNPATIISYTIPEQTHVVLNVFDISGKKVVTLVNKNQLSGSYKIELNGSSLSSGVYLYRLQTENFTQTQKMILLR